MVICEKKRCTGCFACVNSCPKNCISMKDDEYGELHPIVDESKCIGCGVCKVSCPNNFTLTFQYPQNCYASWIINNDKRAKCASGGVCTIISEYVISLGGVVYGTAYDACFVPRIVRVDNAHNIESLKGSKYVQSLVGNSTFVEMRKELNDEKLVLFIGTPCQIAGLLAFLKKEYSNLITIDLICHGVCPTSYFREEISYITKKYNIKILKDVRFRGNDGKNYMLSIWEEKNGNLECSYLKSRYEQPYFAGFRYGVTLRENCYHCNYARPERIGDITIGDFLRLGKKIPFPYKVKHPSVVLVNNKKGEVFYQKMSYKLGKALVNIERDYAERLVYRPSLLEPFPRHNKTDEFREKYKKKGYVKAIRSTLRFLIMKNTISNKLKSIKRIFKN